MLTTRVTMSIPSPPVSEWELGPFTLRAYALCIVAGILVAIWLGNRRWVARGGRPGEVADIAIWAVPFGILGARAYHVGTDWEMYFGAGSDPLDALRIWQGGLGVWGAIAAGVLGGWIAARRRGISFPALADALAPGIVLAQAIGRWGNWFNQELFGRPTDLPWALEIDAETFHPTFLYESLWAVMVAVALLWADRRFRMGHGRVFALYVALYTLGRGFVETLRIDSGGDVLGPAREILGLRINVWTSILLFVGAVIYLVISARRRPGRESPEEVGQPDAEDGVDESDSPAAAEEDAEADAEAAAIEQAWADQRAGGPVESVEPTQRPEQVDHPEQTKSRPD